MAGIPNRSISQTANIAAHKVLFDPTSAGYASHGVAQLTSTDISTGVDPTAKQLGVDTIPTGYLFYHAVDDVFRYYDGSSFSNIATAGGGTSLDGAYNSGSTITVDTAQVFFDGALDGSTVKIDNATSTASALVVLDAAGGGAGHVVDITNAGSGKDIDGNSSNWSIDKTGAVICVGITDTGGITTDTSLATTGSGTLSVAGASTLTGNVSCGGDVAVTGNTTMTGNLTVSGTMTLPTMALADSAALTFGAGTDLSIESDGSGGFIGNSVNDTILNIGNDGATYTTRMDVVINGSTSAANWTLDASADKITNTGIEYVHTDNTAITFGTGEDVSLAWDGTDLDLTAAADDSIFKIGNGTNSFDVWIYGNTANDNIIFDASANLLQLDGIDLYLEDDDNISFGDSQDVVIQWAAAGGLNITGAAADSVITVGADGANTFDLTWHGSGAGDDIVLDASANTLKFDGIDVYHEDADLVVFGDDSDFVLTGTSNALSLYCAADGDTLTIGHQTASAFEMDVQIRGSSNTAYALFDASANELSLVGGGTAFDLILKAAATPSAANDAGTTGKIWVDANYIYVQTGANAIKRVAIATW